MEGLLTEIAQLTGRIRRKDEPTEDDELEDNDDDDD